MRTVWLREKQNIETGTAMLLGGFDGLHTGHRKLVAYAKESGLPVGIMTIVGGKESQNLFTFSEREEIFKAAGIDFVFELPFSEIKNLTPEEFLSILEKEFSPKLFVCGEDFRFGVRASGDPEMLKRSTHVCVEICSLTEIDGDKVSSTRIKSALKSGEVEKANCLLEEPFFLIGEVENGRKIGRTMGFPTANIRYSENKFPLKRGVYETQVEIGGVTYKGITNYGARPTFKDETVLTETYIDGFSGNLYEKRLRINFIRFLREVRKFESVEALQNQLKADIESIR